MDSYWRNSGRQVKFLMFNWTAALLLLFLIFFTSFKMLLIVIVSMSVLGILNYFGFTIPNALRRLRIKLTGRYKSAVTTKRMSRSDR